MTNDGSKLFTGIVPDIMEKKDDEKKILQYAAVWEQLSEAIIFMDNDGTIVDWNKGAENFFGYEKNEIIGHTTSILLAESSFGEVRRMIGQVVADQGFFRSEIECIHKDGSTIYCEATVVPHLDQHGNIIGRISVNRDVTDRKLLQDEREKVVEHLLEAHRVIEEQTQDLMKLTEETDQARRVAEAANRAKSDFLASMSHEIRTPMNGVIGMVGVLLDSDLSPEQRKQALTIKKSSDALLLLLNDILDLSKIEAGQVDLEVLDFDLLGLLDSVTALWESRLQGKGLNFSIEIAADVAPVLRTDPTRIRQILFNLIGNAAKFTEQGGVTLAISQRPLADDELELRFAVIDTGIGIKPDARSRLFTKFSQADGSITRKYGGTGLGLVICQQLTELLGGEIGFESTSSEGSTFWFTIRCAPGNAETVDKEIWTVAIGNPEASESDRTLRILVAEDNHVNQAVLLAMLGKIGHRVDMVANGSEAVSAVIRVPYDLVLMDIQMPEMDGVTASRKIRELPGDVGQVPIIAVTASAMKGDREKYIAAGMTDYVPKPINPHKLFAAIARCSGQESADIPQGT